ncbi:Prx [Anthophora quadrimaculata]
MEDEPRDTCFAAGSVAGAVIGTFLTTILLLLVAALLYRQWRRHKGKHLVLVTDPEIVEEAYAFDNPCFKDVTISSTNRAREGAVSLTPEDTSGKDTVRWSTSWTTLGLGSSNRNDKRKTLDDSCLGLKTTRINVVSLKSRDFTGLGFNICGNMREGIFVKDLLHRGPASESGRIHPGDRIASVKISFQNMVYEDALTILSYASPYDVKLEVESGGIGSKPTTLLKKTVGPSATRICHPLYRSQSIPELSQSKSVAKRLFIVDPNESTNSNYSTMNSTLKSSKSTPSSQTFEKRHNEFRSNHHKFGIKVLPALDGTVQRIENQNEHNTNLERRHSKRLDAEKHLANVNKTSLPIDKKEEAQCQQSSQLPHTPKEKIEQSDVCNVDTLDKGGKIGEASIHIPEVPTEVHNAAMAARRNRKNSSELLNTPKNVESIETEEPKSQQKSKRKAPPPPKASNNDVEHVSPPRKDPSFTKEYDSKKEDKISSIVDYTEPVSEQASKTRESTENVDTRVEAKMETLIIDGRHSESDTDSEIQNSFTTIELNSADITIHRTPVPETNDEDEDDDVYRKAASLGDLSKYECRTSTTLERAQSLDMTDTGTKKRKAPLPPEDINESTEDLTKLDRIDTFDRRLLKKSSDWGNLEDVVWYKKQDSENKSKKSRVRKKSNGSLERSKSAVEIKSKTEATGESREENFTDSDTSIELYNLPLSKRLTEEFIRTERMFNPDEDNSLARIVNDGTIVKSPTLEEVELQFKKETSLPDDFNNDNIAMDEEISDEDEKNYSSNLTEGNGSDSMTINDDEEEEPNSMSYVHKSTTKEDDESRSSGDTSVNSRSSSKRVTEVPVNQRIDGENDEDEDDISSGENSEDSGLVGESMDYNPQEYDNRPPLPNTPMPQKMTYITEIKLPANRGKFQDDNENNETLTIMGNTERKLVQNEVKTTSNGKTASNKKPPVPPRRTDITKSSKKGNAEKQVIYVSEYKSNESKEPDGSDVSPEIKQSDNWSAET